MSETTGLGCAAPAGEGPRETDDQEGRCGLQDDLAVCQACFAQLCKDHRVAPYTPKGPALAKGRKGGLPILCSDTAGCVLVVLCNCGRGRSRSLAAL